MSEENRTEIELLKENYERNLTKHWVELNEIANLVKILREENHSLKDRLLTTEEELTNQQNENVIKTSELEKLKFQTERISEQIQNSVLIDNDERNNLKKQVETLLEKLNTHL